MGVVGLGRGMAVEGSESIPDLLWLYSPHLRSCYGFDQASGARLLRLRAGATTSTSRTASLCDWYVIAVRLVCGWYAVGMWLVCDLYVICI